jgi:ABC-2 type transport system ATP-binding protein
MNDSVVAFQAVIKTYPSSAALKSLTFSVRRGECYAILGRNGAGKTTALRCLIGLTTADLGNVRVFGLDPNLEAREIRQRTAYLPDDPLLYEHLSIVEFLEYACVLWNVSAALGQQRATKLMSWLDLSDHKYKLIRNLSRGMKQKLALAAGLLHEPELIVLDEPLTGVDVVSARLIKDAIHSLQNNGTTVILATHQMDLAEEMADRIGIIHEGRIVKEGSLEQIRAAHPSAQNLEAAVLEIVR